MKYMDVMRFPVYPRCANARRRTLIVGTNVTVTFWYKSLEILGLTAA